VRNYEEGCLNKAEGMDAFKPTVISLVAVFLIYNLFVSVQKIGMFLAERMQKNIV